MWTNLAPVETMNAYARTREVRLGAIAESVGAVILPERNTTIAQRGIANGATHFPPMRYKKEAGDSDPLTPGPEIGQSGRIGLGQEVLHLAFESGCVHVDSPFLDNPITML